MAHKTTIATKEKNERLYRAILALETEEECKIRENHIRNRGNKSKAK